jgi:toxin secretion/phage lysis holin
MEVVKLKVVLSVIGTFIISLLGGLDKLLYALFILSVFDLLTGFSAALLTGKPNSQKAWQGILKKALMFMAVAVGVIVDLVFGIGFGSSYIPPAVAQVFACLGFTLNVRNIILLYAIITEVVSNLENMAKCGLRFPAWLMVILKKFSHTMEGGEKC